MDLKSLKTFHRILSSGSFHRAAEEMNYAQSTVSMQIQRLEAEVGVQLFDRTQKSVGLTEAGRVFYEQSIDIMKRIDQLKSTMIEVTQAESGSVRIGVTEPSASFRFPAILGKFINTHPKVHVSVHIANTPILNNLLHTGEIDIALCSTPEMGTSLFFEPLFQEGFVVLLPEHHPLSEQSTISPEDFVGQRLLITAKNCPYRKKLEVVAQEWNIPLNTLNTLEITSLTALTSYVEHGIGIALVPRIMTESPVPGTIVREMGSHSINMTTGFLYQTDKLPMLPASRALYHFLKNELLTSITP
ncbi:LysR family transcriptional regulator [Sporolactobacillus laevolacticus]|uniref:LysR family transcriptional regulator n=1 Tax=Sporolactobacillus laevolacticus TaxID=33018 RepID=UPI0025B536C5|nr:LysR family transcriptional regulator [Sporolactobacillus laevolacticus]MDN3955183.1 LysR family transcriptional regulator [Sporolactobacillus laevolacticus]